MARTYKRDSRGRFASVGSSTGSSKGKTLKRGRAQLAEARGKVRTAKGKLAAIDPADQTIKSSLSKRAQRGAVTKAEKRLATVKRTAVIKGRRMTGTIGKPKGALKGAGGKLRKPMGGVTRVSRAEPLTTGGGTLAARSSLTRAKRKLAENATPAQRGAVTRANRYAAAARARDTTAKKFGRPASVMRKRPPESPLRWQVGSGGGKGGEGLKRSGQKIKIVRKKPPKPTKEDKAIEKVMRLKVAKQVGGTSTKDQILFIPDKSLTINRRKAIGLSSFSTLSESQRYRVSRQDIGGLRGIIISQRSSYTAQLPKVRQGIVRSPRRR